MRQRPLPKLTAAQELAVDCLAAGLSVKDTAARSGVDRRTVHRWLREDAGVREMLARQRKSVIDAARQRLLRYARVAAACVGSAVAKQKNVKLAIKLLERTGVLDSSAALYVQAPGSPAQLADPHAIESVSSDHALDAWEEVVDLDRGPCETNGPSATNEPSETNDDALADAAFADRPADPAEVARVNEFHPLDPVGEDLDETQFQVMECLFDGVTIAEAAQAAKISERTVYRWLQPGHPFRVNYDRARRDLRNRIRSTIQDLVMKAVDTLIKAIVCKQNPEASWALLRGLHLVG